ncbi:DNA methylase M [Acinetobacter phage MD-2021a]|nr:DNA methylase M [Acinetobacter phage MD-2021a]CAH1087081.1 DNA methylase M [Acinetobacter phage MD-2021a]SST21043.1 Type I restriction-modification system methyltransferase subunit [Acinetobacter baumannii]
MEGIHLLYLEINKIFSLSCQPICNSAKNLDAEIDRKATEQSFLVDKADIAANGYDLSINRYKEVVYEQVQYESPSKILADLELLEQDILKGMNELKELLK